MAKLSVCLAFAVVLLSGCAGRSTATQQGASVTASAAVLQSPSTSASVQYATASPSSTPAPALTGYGALDQEWNRRHTPDANKAPGCCYDIQPSGQDLFITAQHEHSRITMFEMRPDPPVSLDRAKALVASILPFDAQLSSDALESGQCEILWYHSDAVAAIDGHTYFAVQYYSPPPAGQEIGPFDRSHIDSIFFTPPLYDQPDPTVGCS